MFRPLALLLAVILPGLALAQPHIAPTPHLTPEQERAKFKLPEGFDVQLVASEPGIAKPMNMAFDAKGRLWLTVSVEYPLPPKIIHAIES